MGRRLARGLIVSAVLLAALGAADRAQDPSAVLEDAAPGLVCVRSVLTVSSEPFRVERARFSNAGFFVGDQGEVLTSLLGLAGCSEIRVHCPDGRQSDATVAAVDQPSGLALLQTSLKNTRAFTPASALPAPGGWALMAAVRPRADGIAAVLSPALVARHDVSLRLNGVAWEGLTALSGNVWPGCAGAPVLDLDGRLAGVVLAVSYVPGEQARGPEVLVLPVDALNAVVAQLKRGESRRLGWLGVTLTGEPEKREGARVNAVLEDSPARKAGLRTGDIILQIDKHAVEGAAVVARWVVEAGPGQTVNLRVLRGSEILTLPVELEARPLMVSGGPQADRLRPWPSMDGLPLPGRAPEFADLVRENQRLRDRIRELERRLGAGTAESD
jgi:S1-C subfamily serine protease